VKKCESIELAFHFFNPEHLNFSSGDKALSAMQEALSRAEGILSELSRTLYLESGELCQPRMPRRDDTSACRAYSFLAVFIPWGLF
jgi:hypothetical protein